MLIEQYEKAAFLCNSNLREKSGLGNNIAYRGDLVLVEGEVADSMGRRKPPIAVVKQVAMLADDKIHFFGGFLDKLEYLPLMVAKYGPDYGDDIYCVFFVENIPDPIQVEFEGVNYVMFPLIEGTGMVWNELADVLGLEKSDFKGQSAGEKVATVAEGFRTGYTPKAPKLSYEDALGRTIIVQKEDRGPV